VPEHGRQVRDNVRESCGVTVSYTGPITNIVVLMLENRSYDNVLGLLYNPGNPFPYNNAPAGQAGLQGLVPGMQGLTNEDPVTGLPVGVWTSPDPTVPALDPAESFYDMAQQITGAPYSSPDDPYQNPHPAPMSGFVANYAARLAGYSRSQLQVAANLASSAPGIGLPERVRDVMHCHTPLTMPVSAYLAYNFMVCDQWFGSAPIQTFANRNFVNCAQPGFYQIGSTVEYSRLRSFVDDEQFVAGRAYGDGLSIYSIFQQLDLFFPTAAKPPAPPYWKVYFHDYCIAAALLSYVQGKTSCLASYDGVDYANGANPPYGSPTTFLQDVANGTLPPYSFIEPRYSNSFLYTGKAGYDSPTGGLPTNSNHPGAANFGLNPTVNDPATSVANGELLLLNVYSALRTSDYWKSTMLIVIYDEHGGTFDHVSPPQVPAAKAGFPVPQASLDPLTGWSFDYGGFGFNVYGPRVPAIIVSPYVNPQSRLIPPAGTVYDHASVVATIWECFSMGKNLDPAPPPMPAGAGPGDGLTARDVAAPSIFDGTSASGPAITTAVLADPPFPPVFFGPNA